MAIWKSSSVSTKSTTAVCPIETQKAVPAFTLPLRRIAFLFLRQSTRTMEVSRKGSFGSEFFWFREELLWIEIYNSSDNQKKPISLFKLTHSLCSDLNILDNEGNTPMHDAVHSNACDSLNFLLENDANSTILNNDLYAPLHLAALLNKVGWTFRCCFFSICSKIAQRREIA